MIHKFKPKHDEHEYGHERIHVGAPPKAKERERKKSVRHEVSKQAKNKDKGGTTKAS